MKNISTIVYFGNNYQYAKSLATEDILVNFVSEDGQCREVMIHDGKLIEVVRDEIEGDAEFLIFEDKYLDKMSKYVYDMTENIKSVILGHQINVEEILEKFGNRFNILDNKDVIDKVRAHFEKNEDVRQGNFERAEFQRKRASISLSEEQEYKLTQEEKQRVLAVKESSYMSREYERKTFEQFINSINNKGEVIKKLKQCFGNDAVEEDLAINEFSQDEIKNMIISILNKYNPEVKITDAFFNSFGERTKIGREIIKNIFDTDVKKEVIKNFEYIEELLNIEHAEHELYAIIAEDFTQEFLKPASLGDLLGSTKSELLRKFVWKMQLTEREAKRDSLKEAGLRYELGEEDGYKPHVCIISEKERGDIDHSEVAMAYARQSISKGIMGKLKLNETVQLFEYDSKEEKESIDRLKNIIFSERALKDLRYGEKMSEEDIISKLFELLKNQDDKIANHSVRVSCWFSIIMMMASESKDVPKELKISIKDMKENVVACGLHDVGKRLAVVLKDLFGDKSNTVSFIEELGRNISSFANLPGEAKNAIINHSKIGAEALNILNSLVDSKVLPKAEKIAGDHHKEYKVNGNILANDPIINMVTLADCLDAIISGRSYNNVNEPMTLEGTIDILLRDMGGCIDIYREVDGERVPVKEGNWFMDKNIKFHFNEQAFQTSPRVKFNPYFMMMALKFLRHQVVEVEKGKKAHMSFNDETIADQVKENFEKIKDVSEVYQVNGERQEFTGNRHLVTSFAGVAMEQNAKQSINIEEGRSIKIEPIELIEDFVNMVKNRERRELRQTARGGGDCYPSLV